MVGSQGFEPRMPEAADLQSTAVTNAARYPEVVHQTGFEPVIFAVKERCPGPLDDWCTDRHRPRVYRAGKALEPSGGRARPVSKVVAGRGVEPRSFGL